MIRTLLLTDFAVWAMGLPPEVPLEVAQMAGLPPAFTRVRYAGEPTEDGWIPFSVACGPVDVFGWFRRW
jgi:hypothetical protein